MDESAGANASGDERTRGGTGSPFGTAQQINVVVNWLEEPKQRVPVR